MKETNNNFFRYIPITLADLVMKLLMLNFSQPRVSIRIEFKRFDQPLVQLNIVLFSISVWIGRSGEQNTPSY